MLVQCAQNLGQAADGNGLLVCCQSAGSSDALRSHSVQTTNPLCIGADDAAGNTGRRGSGCAAGGGRPLLDRHCCQHGQSARHCVQQLWDTDKGERIAVDCYICGVKAGLNDAMSAISCAVVYSSFEASMKMLPGLLFCSAC